MVQAKDLRETLALRPHPIHFPAPEAVLALRLGRNAACLQAEFTYESGSPEFALQLPEPVTQPQRKDELWRTTCFELFIQAGSGESGYFEVNLSPNGNWNIYEFTSYRQGMRPETTIPAPLRNEIRIQPDQVVCNFTLDLSVKLELSRAPVRLGASAVVESRSGALTYWALHHASEKPDFHRSESFLYRLNLG